MPVPPDPLAGLRGLHVPAPPGVGADGLLIAVAVGLAAAVVLRLLHMAWRTRAPLRREALATLAATRALPDAARLGAQARLLREVVARIAGPAAAGERGERWLARLDAVFATEFFRNGPGRAFGEALYQPGTPAEADRLQRGLAAAFARLPGPRRAGHRGRR